MNCRRIIALTFVVGAVHPVVTGISPAAADVPACDEPIVRDYLRPLERMSPLRRLPESGELPFAPRGVRIFGSSKSLLVLGSDEGASFDYWFEAKKGSRARFTLNWEISAEVAQVNRKGEAVRLHSRVRRTIETIARNDLDRLSLRLRIPSESGLYKAEITFGRKGERLARYGHYFRVLRPRLNVKLVAGPQRLHRGETAQLRIENYGTENVLFGEPFRIEQLTEEGWTGYPLPVGWHKPLFSLGPGYAGRCQRFTIPEDMPAGVYRFGKRLRRLPRTLFAEFEVLE